MKEYMGSNSGKKIHLNIEGEMTIRHMEEFNLMISLAIASGLDIEIDLSQVTEMDKAGLHVMLAAKFESIVRGSRLILVGQRSAVVREIMESNELTGILDAPVFADKRYA